MDGPETKHAAPVFQLPKSGLTLNGTRLVRRKETGEEIAEFELADLSAIEHRSNRDPFMVGLAIMTILCAVALAASFPRSIWAWTGAALCGTFGGAMFLGSPQHHIAFAVGKSLMQFPLEDSREDGQAFVLMLQQTQRRPPRY